MLVFWPVSRFKNEFVRNAQFATQRDDKYSHTRQVTPGDYRRKLQLETIEKLIIKFQSILTILDYSVE